MIADYLERLERELNFDRSLSKCVRQEVEDHLWESVAADASGNTPQAELRAIANFGDARAIAAQFSIVSLARQSRRAGIAAVLIIASVFIAMKARLAWYVAAQWTLADDLRAFGGLVGQIDRYAFWLAIMIGLGGWLYIRSRQTPAAFDPAYHGQLRRFLLLSGATAAALAVSVISDAVLTALLLHGMETSVQFMIPIVSMTIEVGCVGILVFQIHRVTRRAASTVALQQA
jgi:hypothetical protein